MNEKIYVVALPSHIPDSCETEDEATSQVAGSTLFTEDSSEAYYNNRDAE
jgi:hypothetical protein